jgi:hypothetical protein
MGDGGVGNVWQKVQRKQSQRQGLGNISAR